MTMARDCRRLSNREEFWIGVMAAQGEAPQRIADVLGLDLVDVVTTTVGYTTPELPAGHEWTTVMLAAKDRTRIAAEALRRRVEMPVLASTVLHVVAADDLFRAIFS